MSKQRQVELKFQDHLIDSYKHCGGFARKWASEWQVGNPDLIATLPALGLHLVEVKHRPDWNLDWGATRYYENPLDKMQVRSARLYREGGGLVAGVVIVGSVKALGSTAVIFDPLNTMVDLQSAYHVPYIAGKGFDVTSLINSYAKED